MSLSNEPMQSMLAQYVPPRAEPQHLEDLSFRLGEGESLKGVWQVIRKRKLTIAVGGLCGLALAFLLCLLMSRQYAAVATIEVDKTDNSQTSLLNSSAPVPASADGMKADIATHMTVLQSPNVVLAVVRDLNLQSQAPFAFKPSILGLLNGTNDRIRDEINRGLSLEQAPYARERILAIFQKKLKIENTADTRLVTVQYLNPDPKLAADIANGIVREYVTFQARSQATSDAQRWLSEQLADLKKSVDDSQRRLADFEQKTGLNGMVLGATGEGLAGSSTHIPDLDALDALNQQLTAAETDRISKEAVYRLTKSHNPDLVASIADSTESGDSAAAFAVSGASLDLLHSLRQQQSALNISYADMLTKYGANNLHLQETKSQLDSVNNQIARELNRINQTAAKEYSFAQEREAGLRQAFRYQQQKAGNLNVSAVKLQALTQEAASSRQLYDSLYSRLKQVNIQAALRATNISVADPARPPAKPKRPNPPLYMAIGLIAGLFTGLSSAFVREHLDDKVTVALQLHAGSRLPMLANIPSSREIGLLTSHSGSLSTTLESSPLINDPTSAASESFRALRTAIMVGSHSSHLRSLLVTSPLSGEGRSTVAYNTAIAFALAGKRVLLLDADMRKPHLHDLFFCSCQPGLSDILKGTAKLEDGIRQHDSVPSLFLIPAGSGTRGPAELVCSSQFDQLLATLTQKYDLVLADSPPILLVTEARVMSEKFDATLAVIRAGKTTRTVLASLSSVLELSGSRAVGLVLNGVDTNSDEYFDAYGHDGKGEYLNA
jgi:capsular exopolysaccharide synthesis family protein